MHLLSCFLISEFTLMSSCVSTRLRMTWSSQKASSAFEFEREPGTMRWMPCGHTPRLDRKLLLEEGVNWVD